jgi:hypothetical protein
MYQDRVVLCASNSYKKKFYINEDFQMLPEQIKQELNIMCVLFDEDGVLLFKVDVEEGDYFFDEIGSALKVKEIQRTKKELLQALELYYRAFFLDEDISKLL